MERRSRTRRVLKWVGLVACVLILVAWATSLRWEYGYAYLHPVTAGPGRTAGDRRFERQTTVVIGAGCLRYWKLASYSEKSGFRLSTDRHGRQARGYRWGFVWPIIGIQGRNWRSIHIPLWIPFLFVAIPTAILWYHDRQPPRGHCRRCGYNLTGNVTGICPECGELIVAQEQDKRQD